MRNSKENISIHFDEVLSVLKDMGFEKFLPLQEKTCKIPEFFDGNKNIFVIGDTS